MAMPIVRRHFIFRGRVQGVGFRWRSSSLATQYGLTGWVKNLYDGSVEMEVQGKTTAIARLLHELQNDRFIRIDDIEAYDLALNDQERGFRPQL